jgi:PAS domain S-box-containing protein
VRDYAIYALDPRGHVLSWNLGARRLKGYTEEEIVGRHFSAFYTDEDRAAGNPARELEIAERFGRAEDEGWRVRKDGTRFWAFVVVTALRDEHGALVGFAKVTRDLTERKALEERALEDARRAAHAETANRAKSDFLAAMSHELRTPLNAIGGYADLILAGIGGQPSAQQRDYLERMRRSQQHLLAVINDILNFSRLEAGRVTYDIAPLSLRAVMDEVLPMVEPQAAERRIAIVRDRGPDATALGDRAKVEQVLLNLLSNAIKFTEAGGRISLGCERAGDRTTLHVADTGSGIPADRLAAIFEPFVQVSRSLKNPHEGTGLGLAISRDLARGMGGDLAVESTVGEGSRFTLTLPAG